MPYTDQKKKSEWRKRHNEQRREQRAVKIAEREQARGHHTVLSLAWPKETLTEAQAAWVAACIDCEGSLSLGSYWNKQRKSYNFHVGANLQMTVASIPNRLKELCGGSVFHSEKAKVKHKSVWQWHLSAEGLRWLLPQIREHMLVKQRQADLMIEFLTISKRGVSKRAEYNPRAQAIRAEMKNLNQRGIPTSPEGQLSEPIE